MRTGFLSKNHFKNRNNRISLPVILAACLFLASVFCYITFSASSRAQAERIVKKLFTSESYRELEEAANIGLPQMYDTHFPGDFTPEGRDSLLPVGIPYTLFLEQFPSPVERIYAQEPVLALEEESGKMVRYRYTVETEFYLERRLEEVSPVVQKSFTGTITLKKTGFLKWKMEAFTAG